MRNHTSKILVCVSLVILVTFSQLPAQQKNSEQGLIGSWDVQVTARDCATGTPFFSFPALITFNQGGTMEETDLGAPVLVRLPGYGVWSHETDRQYSAAFRFINFNPDRSFAGTNVVRSTVTLAHDSQSYTATDTLEILDANGVSIPGTQSCATQTAVRFK